MYLKQQKLFHTSNRQLIDAPTIEAKQIVVDTKKTKNSAR